MTEQYIGGVIHIKDNSFVHNKKNITSINEHPFGTVYQNGWWGYVANGYDWWKFPILELGKLIKNK